MKSTLTNEIHNLGGHTTYFIFNFAINFQLERTLKVNELLKWIVLLVTWDIIGKKKRKEKSLRLL